ncbi:MAG TPA: polymorphic toxin-type HINT domain-containing protein [Phycisphaerales bacterium]|nr:polymorphic toxin-type HINT domain-containing protein [Phycisphaerales bacterium]
MFVLRCIIAAINCFVAGTLVLTSEGLVPIEQIKPNDIAWAMDEVTREAGWKPVVQTFVTHPTQLHTVTWQTEDGRLDSVKGTGEHPFYVVHADKFVPMASLCAGDTLQLADGKLAWIVKAGLSSGPPDDAESFTTYNFEVEDHHTYFVGETGARLHNRGEARCVKFKCMMEYRAAKHPLNAQNPALDYIEIRAKYEQRRVPLAAADDKDVMQELLPNLSAMLDQNQLDPRTAAFA